MSVFRKAPMAGIFAVIAWLGITGAACADDSSKDPKSLLDSIEPNGLRRHVANTGAYVHVVKVARSTVASQIAITLRIDDGFHINANPASLAYLIPTTVTFVGVSPFRIAYPIPVRFKPKFSDEPLEVYEGTVVITASFMKGALDGTPAFRATVTAQACTDQICLPPADLPVSL